VAKLIYYMRFKKLPTRLPYSKAFIIAIFCCWGTIIYSKAFNNSFHFDDIFFIVTNPSIRDITNLVSIWNFWPTRFITFLSFSLNYHFNNLNVSGYHLVNLTIHIFSSILVWCFVLLTFATPLMKNDKLCKYSDVIAVFTGLIFLSHPVQTESVTYIFQRAASLAGFFYLLSICLYVKSRLLEEDNNLTIKPKFFYIASWIIALLGMFTKENTITLPLMIILYEFYFFKIDRHIKWKRFLPFLIISLIIPVILISARPAIFMDLQRLIDKPIRGTYYFLTQLRVMLTYVRLVFIPLNQNIDYDYPIIKTVFSPSLLLSISILLIILIIAVRMFHRYRLSSFGILYFFLALLPESSLIPLKDAIFEHRLYLPIFGYGIFVTSLFLYLLQSWMLPNYNLERWRRSFVIIIPLIIIILYSVLSYNRNLVWKDELALWDDAVKKSPKKARPYQGRGKAYHEKGEIDRAISDYNRAIEINPNIAYVYYDLGNLYSEKHELEKAVSNYYKAIEIKSDFAEAYNNIGNIYVRKNDLDKAILNYTKAIEIKPVLIEAYTNRGYIYQIKGNLNEAISDYTRAIEIDGYLASAYNKRAVAYFLKQEYEKSWEDILKAERLGYKIHPEFFQKVKKALEKTK